MKHIRKIITTIVLILLLACSTIILCFGQKDKSITDLKEKYANTSSSFLTLDGIDIHYRDEGNLTDSIPIVLIHGTGSSLHTFDDWSKTLTQTKRVIRMDLPAYGLTGPFPNRIYSIANYTSFLNDFLKRLKIKKCILAGNSLGGEIAWNFTLEQPHLITKLILIDAAGYPTISKSSPLAFKLAKTPIINKSLTYITPKFLVRKSIENVYKDTSKITDTLVDRYFDLTLRAGNRQAFIDRFKTKKRTGNYNSIKKIIQPTLILWGDQDLLIPVENAYKFQDDLSNSTLVVLKNTGHVPMEENPKKSLKPVLEFIKKQ